MSAEYPYATYPSAPPPTTSAQAPPPGYYYPPQPYYPPPAAPVQNPPPTYVVQTPQPTVVVQEIPPKPQPVSKMIKLIDELYTLNLSSKSLIYSNESTSIDHFRQWSL